MGAPWQQLVHVWHATDLRGVLRGQRWTAVVAVTCLACTTAITSLLHAGVSALTTALQQELASSGGDVLQVEPRLVARGCSFAEHTCSGRADNGAARAEAMLDRLEASLSGARRARVYHGLAMAQVRTGERRVRVVGTGAPLFRLQPIDVTEGRAWTEGEARAGKPVALLGRTLVDSVFRGFVPRRLRLGRTVVDLIGVTRSGTLAHVAVDDVVLVPVRVFARMRPQRAGASQLLARSTDAGAHVGVREVLHALERQSPGHGGQLLVTGTAEQAGEVAGMETAMRRGVRGLSVVLTVAEFVAVGALMVTIARGHRRSVGITRALGATRMLVAAQGLLAGLLVGGLGVLCGWLVVGLVAGGLGALLDVPAPGAAAFAEALVRGALPTLFVSVFASTAMFVGLARRSPAHLLA